MQNGFGGKLITPKSNCLFFVIIESFKLLTQVICSFFFFTLKVLHHDKLCQVFLPDFAIADLHSELVVDCF